MSEHVVCMPDDKSCEEEEEEESVRRAAEEDEDHQRDDSKTADDDDDDDETRSGTEDKSDADQSDQIQFPDTNISLSHLQPNR